MKHICINIYTLQDYLFFECEELSATWGLDLDCGEKPVGGECGSGSHLDCHGYGHQVWVQSWSKERALGCVDSPQRPGGVRRRYLRT